MKGNHILVLVLIYLPLSLHARPEVGEFAPDFELENLRTGKHITLDAYQGQQLELIFLDSLCPMPHFPGCEAKIVALKADVEENGDRNRLLVFNSYYVDSDFVKAFVEIWQLGLPYVFDEGNAVFEAYGVFATPYRVVIDKEGKVVSRE